ncbi:MAG: hypothetical protein J5828_00715 [Desulfovibrionaceae bacterium]|nr:hypothetical protein [Desulfovibrionaceae bacterium]
MKKVFLLSFICLSFIFSSSISSLAFQGTRENYARVDSIGDKYGLEKLYANSNYDKLLKKCRELIKSEDEYVRFAAWTYIADIMSGKKKIEEAREAIKKMYEINEDGVIASFLSLGFLSRIGEDKKALDDFLAIQKRNKEMPGSPFYNADEKAVDFAGKNFIAAARTVTPSKIWNDFNENEVAAEDQYKGHILGVKGKIGKITTSPLGYPEVTFSIDQFGLKAVNFQFDKESRKDIAKLKKGKQITLGGECQGFVMGATVIFKDAFIVKD